MKQLTTQQIQLIDQRLIDYGFGFIDIRIEVLDHILCLIENKENLDFQQAVDLVFEEQKDYLKEQKRMTLYRMASVLTLKDVFMSPIFFVFWIAFFVLYSLLPFETKEVMLRKTFMLPIAIPGFAFFYSWFLFSYIKE